MTPPSENTPLVALKVASRPILLTTYAAYLAYKAQRDADELPALSLANLQTRNLVDQLVLVACEVVQVGHSLPVFLHQVQQFLQRPSKTVLNNMELVPLVAPLLQPVRQVAAVLGVEMETLLDAAYQAVRSSSNLELAEMDG